MARERIPSHDGQQWWEREYTISRRSTVVRERIPSHHGQQWWEEKRRSLKKCWKNKRSNCVLVWTILWHNCRPLWHLFLESESSKLAYVSRKDANLVWPNSLLKSHIFCGQFKKKSPLIIRPEPEYLSTLLGAFRVLDCTVRKFDAILLSSMWRNFRPFPSIWLSFTSHWVLQLRHRSHTVQRNAPKPF